MSDIITASVTPAMIPGIRKAIDVCDEFSSENMMISIDEVERLCLSDDWKDISKHEVAVVHRHMSKVAEAIANHLRHMIGEGDAA